MKIIFYARPKDYQSAFYVLMILILKEYMMLENLQYYDFIYAYGGLHLSYFSFPKATFILGPTFINS